MSLRLGNVAQLVEFHPQVPHKPGLVAHTSNSSSVEVGSGDQELYAIFGYIFEGSLGYMSPCLKHTNKHWSPKSLCLATQLYCFKYKISDEHERKIKEEFVIGQKALGEKVG